MEGWVMAYTTSFTITLLATMTGYTLVGQLKDSSGNVGSPITTGFVEDGIGLYYWEGSIPDGFRGRIVFYRSGFVGTPLAVGNINPEESENTDIKTSDIVFDDPWVATVPGSYIAGSAGYILGNLASSITTILNRIGAFAGTGSDTIKGAFNSLVAQITSLGAGTITLVSSVSGSVITVYRGTTWIINLTLGDITGQTDVVFTMKKRESDPDTASILQVRRVGGQIYWNQGNGTSGNASLTVNNETTGSITIRVVATDTQNVTLMKGIFWDAKAFIGGDVLKKMEGTTNIKADYTRAIA